MKRSCKNSNLFLPGSQHFAAGGEIELAYHRIRQTSAELRDTEQQGDGKAGYGVRLLHLSEDFQHKLRQLILHT